MLDEWNERWTPVAGPGIKGGQSESVIAEDSEGRRVFVKKLKFNDRKAARRRFVREVRSYETLEHPQLPKLIETNVHLWRDWSQRLYLVLEAIDGPTLAARVVSVGALSVSEATAFISTVLETLDFCHNNDVVHRDIKPSNVMLRNDDPGDAVVVDFGLSFNSSDSDQSDLTRVNEEIGNRFLRVPEHSTGGRTPVADVTQAAGLLVFALTGSEPRVLVDEDGLKPHQRTSARAALSDCLSRGQYRRLQSVFDRAFDLRAAARFPTADSLRSAILHAMADEEPGPGLQSLLAQLDERIAAEDHQLATHHATALKAFAADIESVAMRFAASKRLQCAHGRGPDDYLASVPYGHINLALTPLHGTGARRLVAFRLEAAGGELVVRVEDEVLWRGTSLDPGLEDVVMERLAALYLEDSAARE